MFDGVDAAPQVVLVDTAQLASWAPHVRPHLEKMAAESGGRYFPTDILTAIASRKMQLWLVVRETNLIAVMVSEIIGYPRSRALRMIGLVGVRPRLLRKMVASVEAVAKQTLGCDRIESLHIPRFALILPGFVTTHWFSEKML
jgi:hypothetical protein